MKKRFFSIALALVLLFSTSCDFVISYNVDEVNLDVGVLKDYRIVYINDLHLQTNSDEIDEAEKEFIESRISDFTYNNLSTENRMENLAEAINKMDADLVVFGGDILDYCSESNAALFKASLEKLDAPYMYLRSDHDVEPYWLRDKDNGKCIDIQKNIADNSPVLVNNLGEITVIGINYSQNDISKEALETIKEEFAKGKPVILATHVPYAQEKGEELAEFSESVRNGRRLYRGIDGEAVPNENTQELMNLIYAKDSPVVAVLAAHIHSNWEGKISDKAIEHIFAPCYMGNIGLVNVK